MKINYKEGTRSPLNKIKGGKEASTRLKREQKNKIKTKIKVNDLTCVEYGETYIGFDNASLCFFCCM